MHFIEKHDGRFNTGVAIAKKETAGMSMTVTKDGIGIPEQDLYQSARVLTQALSDEHVLFQRLRNYHWNVRGMHFRDLHALFADQYELVASRIDEAAERIRQLGYPAPATMTEYLQLTNLSEYPGDYPNACVMIGNILEDHEAIVRYMRRQIESEENGKLDIGTVDFLTDLMRDHEKMAWTLRTMSSIVSEPLLKAENKASKAPTEYSLYHSGG